MLFFFSLIFFYTGRFFQQFRHIISTIIYMVSAIFSRGHPRKCYNPENTRRSTNVGLTLAHRLGRWSNVKPTFVEIPVFAGKQKRTHHLSLFLKTKLFKPHIGQYILIMFLCAVPCCPCYPPYCLSYV